ncbi:MAG: S8 family serine peptidase [Deinococcus sp.]|nr:S8 family serine peptidase [Deinococcus sp.]
MIPNRWVLLIALILGLLAVAEAAPSAPTRASPSQPGNTSTLQASRDDSGDDPEDQEDQDDEDDGEGDSGGDDGAGGDDSGGDDGSIGDDDHSGSGDDEEDSGDDGDDDGDDGGDDGDDGHSGPGGEGEEGEESHQGSVADPDDDEFLAGQILVRLRSGTQLQVINGRYHTRLIQQLGSRPIYLLALAQEALRSTLRRMASDPDLLYAEPNFLSQPPESRQISFWESGTTDPTPYTVQYAPEKLGLAEAHQESTGAGVVVAVIDTGVDLDHPALVGHLSRTRRDFIDGDRQPDDLPNFIDDDGDGYVDEATGHGTHVAGIITLVAPGAQIMPLRALNSDGHGDLFTVATAIQFAVDNGAQVINLSLGTLANSAVLADVVADALAHNIVIVTAVGNGGVETPVEFPAGLPQVLTVAATNQDDVKAAFSNFGTHVDLTAPGQSIYSTLWNGTYASWSGTSMAAPFVAGAAALLRAQRPMLSAEQVMAQLTTTAVDITPLNPQWAGKLGAGRLDILAALR